MNRYNVLTRLNKVNLDDLESLDKQTLCSVIIELNLTIRAIGERLRRHGDNYIDELDEACGNADLKEVFEPADEFISGFRNSLPGGMATEMQEKLTSMLFELRKKWKKGGKI